MTLPNTSCLIGDFDGNDRTSSFLVSYDLGTPLFEPAFASGDSSDLRQGRPRVVQPRTAKFTIRLKAADGDALEALLGQLRSQIPGLGRLAEVDVVVGAKGRSSTATLKALRSARASNVVDVLYQLGEQAVVDVTLSAQAYLRGATDTLCSSSAVWLPDVVSLADMVGDGEAPLDLLADFGALQAVDFFAGLYPDAGASISNFAVEAVDLSWSGGAAAADSAGYPDGSGNTVWRNQSASAIYADIDVTDFAPGEYLMVAKCKATTANAATVRHAYCDATPIPSTSLGLLHLGTVTLPCAAVRGSASSTLRVYLTGDGSNYGYLNALFFIPMSWGGWIWWQASSGYANTLTSEDEMLYADDVCALGDAKGGRQLAGKGGVLVMLAEQSTPQPTTLTELTLAYEPLWEQFPSA